MNISEVVTSKYLSAADLKGATPTVTIARVETVEMPTNAGGKENKFLIYFVGKEKGLILNKVNTYSIADLYGPETDNWTNQKIKLITTRVDYQGKRVDAIRIDPPEKQLNPTPGQISETAFAPAPSRPVAQKPIGGPPPGHPAAFDGDEIPFAPNFN